MTDPIIEAIAAYKRGMNLFAQVPEEVLMAIGEDVVIRATYGPPLAILEKWDQPIQTISGASAALSLIREELRGYADSGVVLALVDAIKAFADHYEQNQLAIQSVVNAPPDFWQGGQIVGRLTAA